MVVVPLTPFHDDIVKMDIPNTAVLLWDVEVVAVVTVVVSLMLLSTL